MRISSRRVTNILFVLICSLTLAVVVYNSYTFFYLKNYEFIVEVPCDSGEQSCFVRYCEEEECPPNELNEYRMFALSASDYEKCSDGSCSEECTLGTIECSEIMCGESDEDSCSQVGLEEETSGGEIEQEEL